MDQDETWHEGTSRALGPSHIVLDGDPAPPPQKGHSPQLSAHICCRKMAGWIKMPLGREACLGPSDIVLDGDPAQPPQKGAEAPIFGPCLLWPNGWMDQDATWYGGRPLPRAHCARRAPSPPKKGKGHSPQFSPMSVMDKRLDGSRCHLVRR